MPTKGSRYTWNDRGDIRINSKIDWVFINIIWLDEKSSYIENFMPERISDHYLVSITQINQKTRERRAFQYCKTWSHQLQFKTKV